MPLSSFCANNVVSVEFHTRNTQLKDVFHISKQTWPPGSPSTSQSLPVSGCGSQQTPLSALKPSVQGLSCSSAIGPSLYNPDILITCPSLHFWTLVLLGAAPGSHFSLPLPVSLHSPAQPGHIHSALSPMSLSLTMLFYITTISFLLLHT